jgi:hypothetical protein
MLVSFHRIEGSAVIRILELTCNRYDDDRWPSGSSGGRVVKDNPQFKAKHIVFTPRFRGSDDPDR